MKKLSWITLLLLAALLISSCQATGTGGIKPAVTAAPGNGEGVATAYPPSVNSQSAAYPGASPAYLSLYPGYASGSVIAWGDATALVMNGEVTQVSQTHDLKVTLSLMDGRTLLTTEPAIDEIMKIIDSCGSLCASIKRITQ